MAVSAGPVRQHPHIDPTSLPTYRTSWDSREWGVSRLVEVIEVTALNLGLILYSLWQFGAMKQYQCSDYIEVGLTRYR